MYRRLAIPSIFQIILDFFIRCEKSYLPLIDAERQNIPETIPKHKPACTIQASKQRSSDARFAFMVQRVTYI